MKHHASSAALAMSLLTSCIWMTGCSRLQEAAMPVTAKINAAYPVSLDVRQTQERLQQLLANDKPALDELGAQLDRRLELRALSCTKDVSVGRFDDVESVSKLAMNRLCFQEQDEELLNFLGLRAVGALLTQPPLRPRTAAGPIATVPKGQMPNILTGKLARDDGVGVLFDHASEGVVVEMPGATPIAKLPKLGSLSQPSTSVSPNGRVVVMSAHGRELMFIEAETGQTIWRHEGRGGQKVLGWLDELGGLVLAGADGKAWLADGQTGNMVEHPLAIRYSAFGADIPGKSPRLLMGTARELILVEHARAPQGITATEVKRYTIGSGPGITSSDPVPMRAGRIVVYASLRDIGWLDLESGESGTWQSAPLFGLPFAKLDEERIMFDSSDKQSMALKPWSFDVVNATVTPLELGGQRGLIIDIGDRVGFLRRGSEAWFGDEVTPSGETQRLDDVVSAYQLELQLAKLQRMTEQADREAAAQDTSGVQNRPWSADAPYTDALRRQGGSTLPPALRQPRPSPIEACRAFSGNPTQLRQCLRDARRAEVRPMVESRLASIRQAVTDYLKISFREGDVIAIDKKGRPPAWCETVLSDLMASKAITPIDDETIGGPQWMSIGDRPGRTAPPIVDADFKEWRFAGGAVPHGYVTVHWRQKELLTLAVIAACVDDDNGRAQCNPRRHTSIYVYDNDTPIACNVTGVARPYWNNWKSSMTPIFARGLPAV